MSSKQSLPTETFQVKPPNDQPSEPDEDTSTNPALHQGGAPGQVFHFNKWGLSYGTDDKGHAASLILSVGLLVVLIILIVCGSILKPDWVGDGLKILGTAFTFVAGVAVGKSIEKEK